MIDIILIVEREKEGEREREGGREREKEGGREREMHTYHARSTRSLARA